MRQDCEALAREHSLGTIGSLVDLGTGTTRLLACGGRTVLAHPLNGSMPVNKDAEWKVVTGKGDACSGIAALRCISRADADTSSHQEVAIKPHTTYRLSGWVKSHALRGKVSFNSHGSGVETGQIKARDSGWVEVEKVFHSNDRTTASINILHVAKGNGYFDDVRLSELLPVENPGDKLVAGDAKRGEKIFWEHPVAACKNCHMLGGVGSTVGPALEGIAARKDATYIKESMVEPNKVLAQGFEKLGISPMPPMALILKPQELEDVQAFLQKLK